MELIQLQFGCSILSKNIDQNNPLINSQGINSIDDGLSTNPTISLSPTTPGNLVLDKFFKNNANPQQPAPTSGQTVIFSSDYLGATFASSFKIATTTTTDLSYRINSNENYIFSAVEFAATPTMSQWSFFLLVLIVFTVGIVDFYNVKKRSLGSWVLGIKIINNDNEIRLPVGGFFSFLPLINPPLNRWVDNCVLAR